MQVKEEKMPEVLTLNRKQLLQRALDALKKYQDENKQHIAKHPYTNFPNTISDMLDLIFKGVYRPWYGFFPSSHHITNINQCITGIEQRLSLFQANEQKIHECLTKISQQFQLTEAEQKALLEMSYEYLEFDLIPEALAQCAMKVMFNKNRLAKSTTNNALGIALIAEALAIATANPSLTPKRYALLLVDIYSNCRQEMLEQVPFNEKLAMSYLKLAKEYNSESAATALEHDNPIEFWCKKNEVDYASLTNTEQTSNNYGSAP